MARPSFGSPGGPVTSFNLFKFSFLFGNPTLNVTAQVWSARRTGWFVQQLVWFIDKLLGLVDEPKSLLVEPTLVRPQVGLVH